MPTTLPWCWSSRPRPDRPLFEREDEDEEPEEDEEAAGVEGLDDGVEGDATVVGAAEDAGVEDVDAEDLEDDPDRDREDLVLVGLASSTSATASTGSGADFSGLSMRGISFWTSFSIWSRYFSSRVEQIITALPSRPARPVRPMRCT